MLGNRAVRLQVATWVTRTSFPRGFGQDKHQAIKIRENGSTPAPRASHAVCNPIKKFRNAMRGSGTSESEQVMHIDRRGMEANKLSARFYFQVVWVRDFISQIGI